MAEAILRVPEEPSGPSTEDPSQKQQRLEQLHYRLMAVYVYAINTVCESSRLSKGDTWFNQKLARMYRFATKTFVESHIKSKLIDLRTAYAQIEQSVPDTSASQSFLRWLQGTQESLARFSATLTVIVFLQRASAALWPLIVALAAVGAVWNTIFHLIGHGNDTTAQIEAVAVTFLALGVGSLALAARRKRAFFMASISIPPQTWVSNSQDSSTKMVTAQNVYEAEDDLFRYIDRSKRPETPIDAYLLGFTFFCIAGGWAILYYKDFILDRVAKHSIAHNHLYKYEFFFTFFASIAVGIITIVAGYRRKTR